MRAPITALALLLAASATTIASPTDHVQELQRRALTDYITNLVNGVSVGDLTQGILQDFWNWIPSTDDIKSRLGITDQALLNAPLEVLNIP